MVLVSNGQDGWSPLVATFQQSKVHDESYDHWSDYLSLSVTFWSRLLHYLIGRLLVSSVFIEEISTNMAIQMTVLQTVLTDQTYGILSVNNLIDCGYFQQRPFVTCKPS